MSPHDLFVHNLTALSANRHLHGLLSAVSQPASRLVPLVRRRLGSGGRRPAPLWDGRPGIRRAPTARARRLDHGDANVAPERKFDAFADRFHADLLRLLPNPSDSCCPDACRSRSHGGLPGVGLGLHIEAFLKSSSTTLLCLVEPNPELLFHSFHVVDWTPIIARFSRAGCMFVIITGVRPAQIEEQIRRFIREAPNLAEGALCMLHYEDEGLRDLQRFLIEAGATSARAFGFVDDEKTMLRNSLANLGSSRVELAAQTVGDRSATCPAFVSRRAVAGPATSNSCAPSSARDHHLAGIRAADAAARSDRAATRAEKMIARRCWRAGISIVAVQRRPGADQRTPHVDERRRPSAPASSTRLDPRFARELRSIVFSSSTKPKPEQISPALDQEALPGRANPSSS